MKRFALTVIGIMMVIVGFAQGGSTQGKDFWLSFMHNGYYDRDNKLGGTMQVILSSKRATSGTISNPRNNYTQNFSLQPNTPQTITIGNNYCYHDSNNYETPSDKGIHIVANDTISVYCANIAIYSFDASFVLPTESLGSDYIVQCAQQSSMDNLPDQYKINNQTSAFLIVATEDNTTVNITPTVPLLSGNHPAGQTFTIQLNAGQTYHVRSHHTGSNRDLSGTRVTANDCKKIAVFNGNTLTRLPNSLDGISGFEFVFEQALPLRSWGKHFVVTQSMTRNRDIVKIVSAKNNNEIYKNGTRITTLNANASYEFFLTNTENSCYLEASEPCAVYLYNTSAGDDGNSSNGDPSMVWISPIEQKIDEVTFATFSGEGEASISNHYVNIIVDKGDTGNVYLDGSPIDANSFETVSGNDNYKFTRRQISHGSHRLVCNNGFNAHIYGFGTSRGYAYLAGSKAVDLSTQLTIDNLVVGDGDHLDYCTDAIINFDVEVNYDDAQVTWNFGDGSAPSHAFHAEHSFSEEGEYTITLTVEADDVCAGSSALTTSFTISIHKAIHETLDPVTICWDEDGQVPQIYNENGFFIEYYGPGSYPDTIYGQTQYGCEHTKTMTLFVLEPGGITDIDTVLCRAVNPVFELTLSNGQTISYTDSGHYELEDGSGPCPQTYLIDIEFYDKPEPITITPDPQCFPYYWEVTGETYTESGQYGNEVEGCGQEYFLNLTINGTESATVYLSDSCDAAHYQWQEQEIDTIFTANTTCTFTGLTDEGCLSERTIIVERMGYTPAPEIKCVNVGVDPHYVITATEFNVNRYTYRAVDTLSEDSWTDCKWTLSKDSWQLVSSEEDPHSCIVYPMELVEDTVWLTFTAHNRCAPEGITKSFYLIPSFYGLDENTNHAISIVPNPNHGDMSLCFHGMEGIVNVQIYDMKGLLVDRFDLYNDEESRHNYTLKTPSKGLFLFVFKQDDIQFIRKVLITD
ncbi:MAG: PKD domain-containing protein [Bacteroidales bacterium]|nr:PKD domain-containing protein [Bacteroidales bacterium]MBR0540319.1 PKD domain-containing protein [Bacteroidales bacterium]